MSVCTRLLRRHLAPCLLALLPSPLLAAGTAPAADFSALHNQFGDAWAATQPPQQLLFVHDMSGNKLLRRALEVTDHRCLSDGRLIYLADISGMPGLIASTIALPRMRKLDYPIWLDNSGESSAALPRRDEGVVLMPASGTGAAESYTDAALLLARLLEICGAAATAP